MIDDEPKRAKLLEGSILKDVRKSFIEGGGQISVSLLGMLNRVCGQIYALLFLSPRALSLDDIVAELGVSKGSVSINIRILEDYKLVRKVWMKGTRKDYYEAVDMIPTKIVKEFFDKIRRNIQDSLDMIRDCEELADRTPRARGKLEAEEQAFVHQRLEKIKSFYTNAYVLFEALYSGQDIDTRILKPLLDSN